MNLLQRPCFAVLFACFALQAKQKTAILQRTNKNLLQHLSAIYGIGHRSALRICDDLGLCANTKYADLNAESQDDIDFYIQQNLFIGNEYRNIVHKDIVRYVSISCYRGIRHSQGLPCRGQRTHGNARTVRRVGGFFKTKGQALKTTRRVRP